MRKLNLIMILSVLLFVFQACSEDENVDNPQVVNDLKNLPLGKGLIRAEDTPTKDDKVLIAEGKVCVEKGIEDGLEGAYIKKTRTYKMGMVYTEHLLFNPMTSGLYLGSVFVGNSIATGEYLPVANQVVAPITMTADFTPAFSAQKGISKYVENVTYSKYIDVLNAWRTMDVRPNGASTEYELFEINSTREFNSLIGVGFGMGNVDFETGFMRKKNHVLVKFIQKTFSTSMDEPSGGQILKEVNLDNLKNTMPVYVSDIFYGRMAFAVISNNESLTKLKAALHFVLPESNVNIDTNADYSSILKNADVKAICIGGASRQHGYLINEGWGGLKKFMSEDVEMSSVVPISFTLKYAGDNSLARILSSEEVPVLESYFIPNSSTINFVFRASGLKAKAGVAKKAQVYGYSLIGLPEGSKLKFANAEQNITLLNIEKKGYISVAGTNEFVDVEQQSKDVEVQIVKPQEMSMEEFLKEKIVVTAHFNSTDAFGNITGSSLGNNSLEVSLKDLIFSAKHKKYDVKVNDKRVTDHNATLRFNLSYSVEK